MADYHTVSRKIDRRLAHGSFGRLRIARRLSSYQSTSADGSLLVVERIRPREADLAVYTYKAFP